MIRATATPAFTRGEFYGLNHANSANPAVFAAVNAVGTVEAGNSKGLTSPNVTHTTKGIYCITVPSFAPRGGQVTVRGAGGPTGAQLAVGGTANCPSPAVQVSIWNPSAVPVGPDDAPFYVELYR